MYDYIKESLMIKITELKNDSNEYLKNKGLNAEKASKRISCFVCMDSRKLWAWRATAVGVKRKQKKKNQNPKNKKVGDLYRSPTFLFY